MAKCEQDIRPKLFLHHNLGNMEDKRLYYMILSMLPYFATLARQSMLYRAICSGITLHTANFSFSRGVRRRSS